MTRWRGPGVPRLARRPSDILPREIHLRPFVARRAATPAAGVCPSHSPHARADVTYPTTFRSLAPLWRPAPAGRTHTHAHTGANERQPVPQLVRVRDGHLVGLPLRRVQRLDRARAPSWRAHADALHVGALARAHGGSGLPHVAREVAAAAGVRVRAPARPADAHKPDGRRGAAGVRGGALRAGRGRIERFPRPECRTVGAAGAAAHNFWPGTGRCAGRCSGASAGVLRDGECRAARGTFTAAGRSASAGRWCLWRSCNWCLWRSCNRQWSRWRLNGGVSASKGDEATPILCGEETRAMCGALAWPLYHKAMFVYPLLPHAVERVAPGSLSLGWRSHASQQCLDAGLAIVIPLSCKRAANAPLSLPALLHRLPRKLGLVCVCRRVRCRPRRGCACRARALWGLFANLSVVRVEPPNATSVGLHHGAHGFCGPTLVGAQPLTRLPAHALEHAVANVALRSERCAACRHRPRPPPPPLAAAARGRLPSLGARGARRWPRQSPRSPPGLLTLPATSAGRGKERRVRPCRGARGLRRTPAARRSGRAPLPPARSPGGGRLTLPAMVSWCARPPPGMHPTAPAPSAAGAAATCRVTTAHVRAQSAACSSLGLRHPRRGPPDLGQWCADTAPPLSDSVRGPPCGEGAARAER